MKNHTISNVRLRARTDGIQEVVWDEDGRQKRRSTKTRDVQVARKLLPQIEADIRAPRIPDAPTIGWIIDAHLESKKNHMKAHNHKALTVSLRPVIERLGNLRWDQLTQTHVDDYAKQHPADRRWTDHPGKRAPSNKTISPSTVDKDLRMLRAALNSAHAARHIPGEVRFRINVTAAPPKEVWLTELEVRRLLAACDPKRRTDPDGNPIQRWSDREHLYTFILLSIASAARKEAVLELTWDRVHLTPDSDLKGEKIVDLATKKVAGTSYIDFGEGSGNKKRPKMPIGNNFRLVWQLVTMRPAPSTQDPHDIDLTENRVITFNGKPVKDVKKGIATLVKECGIDKKVTPHTFKHTAVTWMVQKGIPFSTISDLTNTSEKILRKYYSHHRPDYQAQLGDALSI